MGDVIVTDAKTLPAASDNEILVVEQYPGIPKPTNRLANGIYYSFKKVWYNFSKYLVPNSRTITINGDTKDLSENRDWTVDAGAIDSVADTNTVDLTVDVNRQLTADVKYQNTSTIDLSEDAGGLKADLATGAAAANLGFTPENVANKATDFTTINNTLYPSVEAVDNRIKELSLIIVASSVTQYSHTGDTNETYLHGVLIPANTLSSGDFIHIVSFWEKNGSAGTWIPRVRHNTVDSLPATTGSRIFEPAALTASILGYGVTKIGSIYGATTRFGQLSNADDADGGSANVPNIITADWTSDVYIIFSGRVANAADTVILNSYYIYKI